MLSYRQVVGNYIDKFNWIIIPLKPSGKIPSIKNWTSIESPTECLPLFQDKMNPNYGILCGKKSGVFIIDVDVKSNGLQTLSELLKKYNVMQIDTVTCKTASGGYHFYFKYEDKLKFLNSCSAILQGIDIRSDKSQAVLPPSKINGIGNYEWIYSPETNPISVIPDWLFNELSEAKKNITTHTHSTLQSDKSTLRSDKSTQKNHTETNKLDTDTLTHCYMNKTDDEICEIKKKKTELLKKIIPNLSTERSDNYETWYRVVLCAKGHSYPSNELLDVIMQFSRKSSKFDEKSVSFQYKIAKEYNRQTPIGKYISSNSMIEWYKVDNEGVEDLLDVEQNEYYYNTSCRRRHIYSDTPNKRIKNTEMERKEMKLERNEMKLERNETTPYNLKLNNDSIPLSVRLSIVQSKFEKML
jgi:hypothetical protein